MTGAVNTALCDADRERITRAVLNAPAEQSHKLLSGRIGISPEAVRKIRYGLLYASFCPDLDRFERHGRSSTARTCTQCEHWVSEIRRIDSPDGRDIRSLGRCGLGHAEAANVRFGRNCGAFAEAKP